MCTHEIDRARDRTVRERGGERRADREKEKKERKREKTREKVHELLIRNAKRRTNISVILQAVNY